MQVIVVDSSPTHQKQHGSVVWRLGYSDGDHLGNLAWMVQCEHVLVVQGLQLRSRGGARKGVRTMSLSMRSAGTSGVGLRGDVVALAQDRCRGPKRVGGRVGMDIV